MEEKIPNDGNFDRNLKWQKFKKKVRKIRVTDIQTDGNSGAEIQSDRNSEWPKLGMTRTIQKDDNLENTSGFIYQ